MAASEVRTRQGLVRGVAAGDVVRFRNGPYGQAPVGRLRFAPPAPPPAWSGVLDATGPAVVAPQAVSRLAAVVGDITAPRSEDCLRLSITTPSADGQGRPVLVWLHGGGYSSGGGGIDWYDGAALCRDGDAVVVGVNYRLGPLGFLRVDGIGNGDAGLLDIVAALRWVHDNIAAFGGDPGRVTLFGQSAGAHAALMMLANPAQRTLFHRAILQSAPGAVAPLTAERAAHHAALLHRALGDLPASTDALARRLQAEPVERLLDAAGRVARDTAVFGDVAPPFLPTADGIDGDLVAGAARGAAAARIPVIVGTTRDEATAMIDRASAERMPPERVRRLVESDGAAGRRYWLRRADPRTADVLADVVTDRQFAMPSRAFGDAVANAGGAVWMYRLDWAPTGSSLGACHCIDLPLVFGTADAWAAAPMLTGADPAQQAGLSALMRGAWLRFAHTGEPDATPPPTPTDRPHRAPQSRIHRSDDALVWPRYQTAQRPTMLFAAVSGIVGDPTGAS